MYAHIIRVRELSTAELFSISFFYHHPMSRGGALFLNRKRYTFK